MHGGIKKEVEVFGIAKWLSLILAEFNAELAH
jgi:hypothetical protein